MSHSKIFPRIFKINFISGNFDPPWMCEQKPFLTAERPLISATTLQICAWEILQNVYFRNAMTCCIFEMPWEVVFLKYLYTYSLYDIENYFQKYNLKYNLSACIWDSNNMPKSHWKCMGNSTQRKFHIFWEGHKISQNLHLTFDYSTYSQT